MHKHLEHALDEPQAKSMVGVDPHCRNTCKRKGQVLDTATDVSQTY